MEIFDSFFKDMKNKGNINHRENRSGSLTYTYISVEERRNEIVPKILGFSTN